jgi:predicted RNA-binding protein with PUA-like domain
MAYWLAKTEPATYSWSDLVRDHKTSWTGVRNFQARNNLRAMQVGDEVFVYHSGDEKAIVGIAKVVRAAYPDTTAKEGDWSTVDLAAVKPLKTPISLAEIKKNAHLKKMVLVQNSRLSVQPVSNAEWEEINSD